MGIMPMVTITIPKLPAWKPVKPLILHADFWLLVTIPNVPKSMSTTECYPLIPVILTVDFSLILTSYLQLVLAIFPNKLPKLSLKPDPKPDPKPAPKPLNLTLYPIPDPQDQYCHIALK